VCVCVVCFYIFILFIYSMLHYIMQFYIFYDIYTIFTFLRFCLLLFHCLIFYILSWSIEFVNLVNCFRYLVTNTFFYRPVVF